MTREDYKKLQDLRFINYGGAGVQWYWSPDDIPYTRDEIDDIVLKDLKRVGKIDFKNCIILFSIKDGTMYNFSYGKGYGIAVDHCTYSIDVCEFLEMLGIKFKNGASPRDERYTQISIGKIIIEDGIAYISNNSNPDSLYGYSTDYDRINEIAVGDKKLDLTNKEILFSGIVKHLYDELKLRMV